MLFLPLVLILNTQPSRMTHGDYPNDMGLLAIVRICQIPVAIPWHSLQGVHNDVIQIDAENYQFFKKITFIWKLQESGDLRHGLIVKFYQ